MGRPEDVYLLYSRAWNEPERTRALLEECWADDGVYADDEVPDGVVGRDAIAEMIAATHEELPGFRVWETSPTRMLAGRLCVTWTQEGGDPPQGFSGSDVIEFAADGRIARVTGVLAPDRVS
jgi:hypothetical protein